mmetsp:Transcript_5546/g.8421  ORF Transcript_5546/g.8421 Transcript_5546/m.8421 type:complete len:91 (+) Transcript_5546:368-640(+)
MSALPILIILKCQYLIIAQCRDFTSVFPFDNKAHSRCLKETSPDTSFRFRLIWAVQIQINHKINVDPEYIALANGLSSHGSFFASLAVGR